MAARDERPNVVPWPPLLLVLCGLAGLLAAFVVPAPTPWGGLVAVRVSGLLVMTAAAVLDWAAMREMRRLAANIYPHRAATALVTTGPFALTRNPIYLANVGLLAGAGLTFDDVWLVVAAVVDGLLTWRLAIRREEAHLAHRFGAAWSEYARRTPRWLGLRRRG